MSWFLVVLFFWSDGSYGAMQPSLHFETEATCMEAKVYIDDAGIQKYMLEPKMAVDSYKSWCLPMKNPRGI